MRRQYASLKCDLTPVRRDSAAYAAIAGYLRRGWAECTLEAIFEATLAGQTEAFEPHRKSNVHLLWHGSSLSNWAGILSGGLRIAPPEAPVNGYNFDKGLYFADVCAKSAQYCRVHSGAAAGTVPRRGRGRRSALKRAPDHNSNNARRLSGKDSVVAMGLREPDPVCRPPAPRLRQTTARPGHGLPRRPRPGPSAAWATTEYRPRRRAPPHRARRRLELALLST